MCNQNILGFVLFYDLNNYLMNIKRKARENASKYYSVSFTKLSRKKKKKLKLIYYNHTILMMQTKLWDNILAYYPFINNEAIPKKVFNFKMVQ